MSVHGGNICTSMRTMFSPLDLDLIRELVHSTFYIFKLTRFLLKNMLIQVSYLFFLVKNHDIIILPGLPLARYLLLGLCPQEWTSLFYRLHAELIFYLFYIYYGSIISYVHREFGYAGLLSIIFSFFIYIFHY